MIRNYIMNARVTKEALVKDNDQNKLEGHRFSN